MHDTTMRGHGGGATYCLLNLIMNLTLHVLHAAMSMFLGMRRHDEGAWDVGQHADDRDFRQVSG